MSPQREEEEEEEEEGKAGLYRVVGRRPVTRGDTDGSIGGAVHCVVLVLGDYYRLAVLLWRTSRAPLRVTWYQCHELIRGAISRADCRRLRWAVDKAVEW